MPYQARIASVQKYTSQADNKEYLSVEFEIREKNKIVVIRRLGFPLGTEAKTIEAEVRRYVKTFASDQELAATSREVEKTNSEANKTIKALTGKTL